MNLHGVRSYQQERDLSLGFEALIPHVGSFGKPLESRQCNLRNVIKTLDCKLLGRTACTGDPYRDFATINCE